MNVEKHQIAQLLIDQYNHDRGTRYEFECFRKSMFGTPKYKYPAFEIYQMAFIEGKKRSTVLNELLVLFRIQKRLIVEVVEPNTKLEDIKGVDWTQLIEGIIDPIERDALGEVVCAQSLIIDGRSFEGIKIGDTQTYRKNRIERDRMFEKHQAVNKRLGIKKEKEPIDQELHQLGIPIGHWFKEIWIVLKDKGNRPMCLQIW
ncbi:MAG: hypothetical protein JRC90_02860 [Deltaproteobacteria bacterium]|nr:hypothetical protein [Deltaproteobacteria bacterium]